MLKYCVLYISARRNKNNIVEVTPKNYNTMFEEQITSAADMSLNSEIPNSTTHLTVATPYSIENKSKPSTSSTIKTPIQITKSLEVPIIEDIEMTDVNTMIDSRFSQLKELLVMDITNRLSVCLEKVIVEQFEKSVHGHIHKSIQDEFKKVVGTLQSSSTPIPVPLLENPSFTTSTSTDGTDSNNVNDLQILRTPIENAEKLTLFENRLNDAGFVEKMVMFQLNILKSAAFFDKISLQILFLFSVKILCFYCTDALSGANGERR